MSFGIFDIWKIGKIMIVTKMLFFWRKNKKCQLFWRKTEKFTLNVVYQIKIYILDYKLAYHTNNYLPKNASNKHHWSQIIITQCFNLKHQKQTSEKFPKTPIWLHFTPKNVLVWTLEWILSFSAPSNR
jgi:hypothetical protein